MKDGCLNKLIITECSHQATQFKKIHNVLSVLCAEKEFKYVDDIICINKELVNVDHLSTYPNETRWPIVVNVKIDTIDPTAAVDAFDSRPNIKVVTKKTHVFNTVGSRF